MPGASTLHAAHGAHALVPAVPRRPARTPDQQRTTDPTTDQPRNTPNQTRSTALFQLATEIQARTLGIHTDVAVAWQQTLWLNFPPRRGHRLPSRNGR